MMADSLGPLAATAAAHASNVVPVSVSGFTWTAGFSGASLLVLLGILIKQIGPWKKQTTDAEEKLRAEMWTHIESLRGEVSTLRAELVEHHARCDKIITEIRAQHGREMHDLREHHLLELANALGRKMTEERQTQ